MISWKFYDEIEKEEKENSFEQLRNYASQVYKFGTAQFLETYAHH